MDLTLVGVITTILQVKTDQQKVYIKIKEKLFNVKCDNYSYKIELNKILVRE